MAKKDLKKMQTEIKKTSEKVAKEVMTAEKKAEKEVKKAGTKMAKEMDVKLQELEEYIKEEPLKSVTAAFLLGIFVGKVMK